MKTIIKHTILIITWVIFFTGKVNGQMINSSINKDSLVQVITSKLSDVEREDFLTKYNESYNKDDILYLYILPKSSKKELIENFDNKKKQILKLKEEFLKLVPDQYRIEIGFIQEDIVTNTRENLYLNIQRKNKKGKFEYINNNFYYKEDTLELQQQLHLLGWDKETLYTIKELLSEANCISIRNGKMVTIGFALSGMTSKYSYKIFDSNLTKEEIPRYNQCTFIYYKDNIVLEYICGYKEICCFPDE